MDNSIFDGMKIPQFDISYTPDLASSVQAQIEIWELRNTLSDMQQEAIYFKGCYDSVGYLKKAGILLPRTAALAWS